jgi:Flp pilus assembly protein TadD
LLATTPDYHDARLQLGLVDIAQGRLDDAERTFRRYYKPGSPDLRPLEGLVEVYLAGKRFAEATTLVEKELITTSVSSAVRALLARTAARAGETVLGIAQYELLIAAHPTTVDYYLRLAELQQTTGEYSKAVSTLEKASQLSPDDADVALQLGYLLERAGGARQAAEHYRTVLAQRSDDPVAQNNLAHILADTGGNLEEALRLAQRAQAMLPDAPEVADTIGWIYLKQDNIDSALQVFTNLVNAHPENPTYRYHLGAALLKKGNVSEAREELKGALANDPAENQAAAIRALMESIG